MEQADLAMSTDVHSDWRCTKFTAYRIQRQSKSVPLWGIFRNVGWYEASVTATSAGYTIVPVMCQVFLIIPKIAPGLKKSLQSYH